MKRIFLVCGVLIWALALLLGISQAAEQFPYLAEVKTDQVNLRAGPHTNFEVLSQLSKGNEVVVIGKEFEWYKIKLPEQAKSFVNRSYVKEHGGGFGEVTGNRVNIRSSPGPNSSIIGQLNKGDKFKIVEQVKEWYQIEPVEGLYGWVSEQFLAFKSAAIPNPKVVQLPSRNIYKRKKQLEEEERIQKELAAKEREKSIFGVTGIVALFDPSVNQYRLFVDESTFYDLHGVHQIFDQFLNKKVQVEGILQKDLQTTSPYPVIDVVRIRFII